MTRSEDDVSGKPILHLFAISHYCERARWALDFHGIDYRLRHLAPGSHIGVAKQIGAASTSVPMLVLDDRIVEGSGAIVDWAESRAGDASRSLDPDPEFVDVCRILEQQLEEVVGVHVRRYYYAEAIVDHPETVRPLFEQHLEPADRQALGENWQLLRRLMVGAMDLGPEQRHDSRRIVDRELDRLDAMLSDGRRFLFGDRFTRADLTAASLLAPIAQPGEHPTYGMMELPPKASADLALWAERPSLVWVRQMYRQFR